MEGPAGRMIGRDAELQTLARALAAMADGDFVFMAVTGDPGVGKTRLLGELAIAAARGQATTLWGRAAEFEREMPFGVMVDALDDHVESRARTLAADLGAGPAQLLATVFPSLSAAVPPGSEAGVDLTGLARYRLFRTVAQLLGEMAGTAGLVLILDDVHWADETSVEFLDHLARHPPRGRTLVAVGYRPAQAPPRLMTLVDAAAGPGGGRGHHIPVGPFSQDEVREFLGPEVSRARCQTLYEASGGNPFYLEALAQMGRSHPGAGRSAPAGHKQDAPAVLGDEGGGLDELPDSVRASLQAEFASLSAMARLVAQGAAVAGESFEPELAAVAAEIGEDAALEAFDEMTARDIVRTAGRLGRFRFRFRHPLVRGAAYASAAPGWRLAAHARIAAHLTELGAPVTARAPHVERSARIGDRPPWPPWSRPLTRSPPTRRPPPHIGWTRRCGWRQRTATLRFPGRS
jgi:predicted ATPase